MKRSLLIASLAVLALSGCGHRDGEDSFVSYNTIRNDGQHVAYGSTDARLFDMTSPDGHKCTVAATDNNQGGIAMHCWN